MFNNFFFKVRDQGSYSSQLDEEAFNIMTVQTAKEMSKITYLLLKCNCIKYYDHKIFLKFLTNDLLASSSSAHMTSSSEMYNGDCNTDYHGFQDDTVRKHKNTEIQ